MVIQWFPILLGWLIASMGLVAEHVALWRQPWRLDAPWNYVIGVLTILLGCGVWASAVQGHITPDEAWIAYAIISVGSGAWIALAYYVRARLERGQKQAQKRGEIVGSARGMIAELENTHDGTHDPRRHN